MSYYMVERGDKITLTGLPGRVTIDGVEVIVTDVEPEVDEDGRPVSYRITTRPVTDAD